MTENGVYVPAPRPNPRLRPEGAAYAERNRVGTMEKWFDYGYDNSGSPTTTATTDTTIAASAAVDADAGGDRQQRGDNDAGSGGQVKQVQQAEEVMGGDPGPPPQPAAEPRPAQEEVAITPTRSDPGSDMQDMTNSYSNLSVNSDRPTPRVIGTEANEYAERNRGQLDNIINNYNVTTPPAESRSAGGQTKADKGQGTSTSGPVTDTSRPVTSPVGPPPSSRSPRESKQRSLHQESQGGGWDEIRPSPRIRAEGETIAAKNTTDSMFDIMRSDHLPPPPHSPVKETKSPIVMQEPPTTPKHSANMPRTRPGEGMRNYERAHNQTEMAAILRGEGDQRRSAPARNVRHLQRSELW